MNETSACGEDAVAAALHFNGRRKRRRKKSHSVNSIPELTDYLRIRRLCHTSGSYHILYYLHAFFICIILFCFYICFYFFCYIFVLLYTFILISLFFYADFFFFFIIVIIILLFCSVLFLLFLCFAFLCFCFCFCFFWGGSSFFSIVLFVMGIRFCFFIYTVKITLFRFIFQCNYDFEIKCACHLFSFVVYYALHQLILVLRYIFV